MTTEEKIRKIREAAATGLDLSPGDPIAILAMEVISEFDALLDEVRP